MVVVYKKNFLTNVIFKVDFLALSDLKSEKIIEFQRLIKGEFPILEDSKILEVQNIFGLGEDKVKYETKEFPRWLFFDKNKKKVIALECDNLVLESHEYTNFEDYFKMLNLIIEGLFKIFPPITSKRIGLRYINNITPEDKKPFELEGLFNKSLLTPIGFINNKDQISRHLSLIELNTEEYRLKFQYGIANSVYPNPIVKNEFILDYDCFLFESLEKNEILEKVKEFNNIITDLFEKSIEEELRKILKEEK